LATDQQAAARSTPVQRDFEFWKRMSEIYPHRWTSAVGDTPSPTWVAALASIPGDLIAIGLRRCLIEHPEWPPALGEFAALCNPRPEDLGLPAEADAYREAVWLAGDHLASKPVEASHPAVWHAAQQVGLTLLTEYAEAGKREFKRVWPAVVRMVMTGQPLTPVPKALMDPNSTPRKFTDEEARERDRKRDEALAKLTAMFPPTSRAGAFAQGDTEATP
jgi:hypothetical protein